ncbi:MAG TPA: hypothetical protein VF162_14915 [Streptosporangiaceae bacterium]
MFLSLIAALVAALCYGLAAVMQAIAVRASSHRLAPGAGGGPGRSAGAGGVQAGGVDPGLIIRMLRQWRFLASLGIDMVGFACQLIALRRLPLFEVQVIIAGNLAVTAVFASWLMHAALTAREWLAVSAVVLGVGMLGSSAGDEGAAVVGPHFHLALIAALAAITLAGLAAARLPGAVRTPVLGAIAGLGYGVLAVCARILPGFTPQQLLRSPAAYTLAAAGIISFLLYASALESGSVTVATAAVILVETIPPAIVGVLLLGDTTRPGRAGLAAAGFALALASAIALARFGEASGHESAAAAPRPAPARPAQPAQVAQLAQPPRPQPGLSSGQNTG